MLLSEEAIRRELVQHAPALAPEFRQRKNQTTGSDVLLDQGVSTHQLRFAVSSGREVQFG